MDAANAPPKSVKDMTPAAYAVARRAAINDEKITRHGPAYWLPAAEYRAAKAAALSRSGKPQ